MSYKLVAMDVDGTLVGHRGVLPEENKKVIKALNAKGVHFVIATGRNDIFVTELVHELGIAPVVIGCNGASVRDLDKDIQYFHEFIRNEPLREIFRIGEEEGVVLRLFSLESYYQTYSEQEKPAVQKEKPDSSYSKTLLKEGIYTIIYNFEQLLEHQDEIIKVVIINNDHDKLLSFQEKARRISGVAAFRSSTNCLDIVNENASKGNALKVLSERLGIKQDEVVAIGDNENDRSMLEFAGFAVAMENGDEALKSIADMVTKTNTEAGVAHALKKIFGE